MIIFRKYFQKPCFCLKNGGKDEKNICRFRSRLVIRIELIRVYAQGQDDLGCRPNDTFVKERYILLYRLESA